MGIAERVSQVMFKEDRASIWIWAGAFIIFALAIAPEALPNRWASNEIAYFDFAYNTVNPESVTPQHSIVDSSNSRIVAFTVMGWLVEFFGFEGAKKLLTFCIWIGLAGGLAKLATVWRLDAGSAGLAVGLFLLVNQSLLGGEWIFGTVEPKEFAYVGVIFATAFASERRWLVSIVLMAVATYFHFLVGGFGALTVILLLWLQERDIRKVGKVLGVVTLITLPIVVMLFLERIVAGPVDLSGLDLTPAEIYAEFRTSHHVAPFVDLPLFFTHWFPGVFAHAGLAACFAIFARADGSPIPRLAFWLACLNAYIVVVLLLAFVDRDTHLLAPFYMFRPSSIILLFSLFGLLSVLRGWLNTSQYKHASVAALVMFGALYLVPAIQAIDKFVFKTVTLEEQIGPERRLLAHWLRDNTPEDSAVLIQMVRDRPHLAEGWAHLFAGFERLTGRGTIVNFKFTPSVDADIVRWYRLLQARSAFFAGDCSQLDVLAADYVVVYEQRVYDAVEACGTTLGHVAGYMIIDTRGNRE